MRARLWPVRGGTSTRFQLSGTIPTAMPQSLPRELIYGLSLWGGCPVSLSLKNLIGLYGARYYGHNKDSRQRADDPRYALPGEVGREQGAHQPSVPMSVCALNSVVQTHLAIVDAVIGMEGDGPIMGTPRHVGAVVLGRNPTAVDATCARLMGVRPSRVPYLAAADGWLGPIGKRQIEQRGERVADLRTPFALLDSVPAQRGLR